MGDHEVALGNAAHVGSELLHHADELVADRAGLERRVAAVVPEVRAADAGEHDAHDGVSGLAEDGVGPVAGLDAVRLLEDGCTHGFQLSAPMAKVGGPVRGVLTGNLWPAGIGVA